MCLSLNLKRWMYLYRRCTAAFFRWINKNGGYMAEEFNPKLQKLKQMQSLPLEQKIIVSKQRIKQWLEAWEDQCIVSFSGGVDSTVLLDLEC